MINQLGSLLELALYCKGMPDSELFEKVTHTCLESGASFTGKICIWKDSFPAKGRFGSIWDYEVIEDIIPKTALRRVFKNKEIMPLSVSLEGILGGCASVTYKSISPKAAKGDTHPVAILTSGDLYEGPRKGKAAYKQGLEVYSLFVRLMDVVQPTYASISHEISLNCLTDLKDEPDSYVFQDFFVSKAFLGPTRLAALKSLFVEAFIEERRGGPYISCSPWFNRDRKRIRSEDACLLSCKTAKIITGSSRKRQFSS